jgi:hypothetical protein
MASVVEICNLALTKVGEDSITSLTENTKAGRLCNLHYGPLRDSVLSAHNWNFAMTRVALALLGDAPAFDYSAQFALPVDCLRVYQTNLPRYQHWKVEGRFLLCDASEVSIIYIKKVEDPNLFSALFVEALAARIAAELAQPLSDSPSLVGNMFNLYERKLREARSFDAQEGHPEGLDADAWLDSRLSGATPYTYGTR